MTGFLALRRFLKLDDRRCLNGPGEVLARRSWPLASIRRADINQLALPGSPLFATTTVRL